MNAFFAREVYIRLMDDQAGFVCTVKYGRFYAKSAEFVINHQTIPKPADEQSLVLLRRQRANQAFENR